jgi:hypothetical protein
VGETAVAKRTEFAKQIADLLRMHARAATLLEEELPLVKQMIGEPDLQKRNALAETLDSLWDRPSAVTGAGGD